MLNENNGKITSENVVYGGNPVKRKKEKMY
jgi:hypothetical protein